MITASIDIGGFNRMLSAMQNAIVGTSQDSGIMLDVAKSEVKGLSLEINHRLGPTTLESARKYIGKDVRKTFAVGPSSAFTGEKRGGGSGIVWLQAGPEWLVGTKNDNPYPSIDEMLKALRSDQKRGGRGNKYLFVGMRGRQHVKELNRWAVSRERIEALVQRIMERVGRMKGSFAMAAHKLGFHGLPKWVTKHFDSLDSSGVGVYRLVIEGNQLAYIEFGSRAPKVVSNNKIQQSIREAILARRRIMNEKVKKILSGFAYDWNTGGVIPPHHGKDILRQLEANEAIYNSL